MSDEEGNGANHPRRKRNNAEITSDISEDDISDVNDGAWEVDGEEVEEDDLDDESEEEIDHQRLANMTELEREMELAERAERQQQKRQRDELLRAASGRREKKETPPEEKKETTATVSRKSGREVREESRKKSAIEELKAARQKKSSETYLEKKLQEQEADYEYFSSADEEEDGMLSLEDEGIHRDFEDEEDEEEASYQEVKSIQVRRHKLEEWIVKPFFERTLPGCMVRLAAGNKKTPDGHNMYGPDGRPVIQYMAAKVSGLIEKDPGYYKYLHGSAPPWKSPYQFGEGKTSLWLRVTRGDSERIWPLAQVSNSSITEQEFSRYHQLCEQNKIAQISRGHVERVKSSLIAAENYVYTAEDVAKLLEEKRNKGGGSRRNAALEKARLERERDAAQQRGEMDVVVDLEREIEELATLSGKKQKSDALSALNKKNANLNFKTIISSGQVAEGNEKNGEESLDPFRRRVTRPIVYWNTSAAVSVNPNDDQATEIPLDANKDVSRVDEEDKRVHEVEWDDASFDVSLLDGVDPTIHNHHHDQKGQRLYSILLLGGKKRRLLSQKFLDDKYNSSGTARPISFFSLSEYEQHKNHYHY
eukprot:jgi/Picsp_1/5561/NSC_02920-R1_rna polymerase-associated protein rtf1 homolog